MYTDARVGQKSLEGRVQHRRPKTLYSKQCAWKKKIEQSSSLDIKHTSVPR